MFSILKETIVAPRTRAPRAEDIHRRVSIWSATIVSIAQPATCDCSGPAICVKSLNMRKWMKDRLQRRKKKTPEQGSQPAPPPLQPAYFDAEAPGPVSEPVPSASSRETHHESTHEEAEIAAASEPEFETQPVGEESPSETPSSRPAAASEGARGRGRRRRGGRGRGGRGREQAVAQAFTPAAVKGIVPDPHAGEEAAPEDGAIEEVAPEEAIPAMAAPAAQAAPRVPSAAVPAAAPRPPKGIVVLAIGLPGSGKSSWFKRHSVVPLSSDMMRTLLFDDVREQRFVDLVFSNLRSMLKARLIAKRPMNYVDATNLTPQERQHWIKLAKDYNYEVHAVFFDVPLEVCIERHQRRDLVVPEDVMRRMAAKLKAPAFEEGFAKITVVRVKKKD
jgi:predicted kinase